MLDGRPEQRSVGQEPRSTTTLKPPARPTIPSTPRTPSPFENWKAGRDARIDIRRKIQPGRPR